MYAAYIICNNFEQVRFQDLVNRRIVCDMRYTHFTKSPTDISMLVGTVGGQKQATTTAFSQSAA